MTAAESLPPPEGLAARAVALDLLGEVIGRRKPLDQALEESHEFAGLPSRDRAFARMLVSTTLRRGGQIDDLILKAAARGRIPEPPALYNMLRLGVAQIAFMAVPDYAAVDSSVRLADDRGLSRGKAFVNAVLRRVAGEYRTWLSVQDEMRLNTPDWLMSALVNDYGQRVALDIAQAHMTEAPLDITLKDPAAQEYWARELAAEILPTGSLRRASGGSVADLPGYADGMWWVQDAAAAIPARLLGDVKDKTVIDLCAAPGGKTAQLAAAGAHVIALDRSLQRLKRLEDNLRRLRVDHAVAVVAADAASWAPSAPATHILLDAPCTATGTMRRHPDLPYLKNAADAARLQALQARLLDAAAAMLAPGGILIYCVCALQKDEGERQIDQVLARHPYLTRRPVMAAELGGLDMLRTTAGDVRILPTHLADRGGMDGFFAARLTRR